LADQVGELQAKIEFLESQLQQQESQYSSLDYDKVRATVEE